MTLGNISFLVVGTYSVVREMNKQHLGHPYGCSFHLPKMGERMPEGGNSSMFETVKLQGDEIGQLKKYSDHLLKGQNALFEWKKKMEKWWRESDANYHDLKLLFSPKIRKLVPFFNRICISSEI